MAEIYALFSGRDGIVRYVGQTTGTAGSRFEQHKRSAEHPSQPLHQWFHSEWIEGYPVNYAILQSCDASEVNDLETAWIRKFPNLLNRRKLNPWMRPGRVPTPPVVQEIVAYRRRYIFNASGFRGIHYDRQWERYFVLFYSGRAPEWLIGDENPGCGSWGGNIWFSHLPNALNARDSHREAFAWWCRRQGTAMNWPPDVET
jgi:hypothetical protein